MTDYIEVLREIRDQDYAVDESAGMKFTLERAALDAAISALAAQGGGEDFEAWFAKQDSRTDWRELVRLAYYTSPPVPAARPDVVVKRNDQGAIIAVEVNGRTIANNAEWVEPAIPTEGARVTDSYALAQLRQQVIEAHTGENADGCGMTNTQLEEITAAPAPEDGWGDAESMHFNDAEALASWLESLHECDASGAVGSRKWDAAQRAAAAIRRGEP